MLTSQPTSSCSLWESSNLHLEGGGGGVGGAGANAVSSTNEGDDTEVCLVLAPSTEGPMNSGVTEDDVKIESLQFLIFQKLYIPYYRDKEYIKKFYYLYILLYLPQGSANRS